VEFVREHAEQVISAGAGLCFQLQPHAGEAFDENMGAFKPGAGMVETELINGEGTVKWCCNGNGIHRCEAQFSAEEPTCGIGFKLSSDSIEFSSCGQEDKVEKMALTSFGEEGGILLSPTGLYSLGKDLYLIRHNRHVSVGAQAGNGGTFLRFVVDFAPEGRQFEWPVHDR
jgi:hypothetical protein